MIAGRESLMDPLGAIRFEQAYSLGHRSFSTQANKKVDVIGRASSSEKRAVNMFQDAAEVIVEARS